MRKMTSWTVRVMVASILFSVIVPAQSLAASKAAAVRARREKVAQEKAKQQRAVRESHENKVAPVLKGRAKPAKLESSKTVAPKLGAAAADLRKFKITVGNNGDASVIGARPEYCFSGTCEMMVEPDGRSAQISAVGKDGWIFDSWGGDCTGKNIGEGIYGTCYVDKTKDRAVSVKFKAANMQTVAIIGREGGEIWLERDGSYGLQAQSCRGKKTCSFKVHYGASLKFRTEASFGFQFVNWGGDCSGNGLNCTLTANRDTKVTANFVDNKLSQSKFRVTVGKNGDASVIGARPEHCFSGTCELMVQRDGRSAQISAVGKDGWIFDSWGGDCSGKNIGEGIYGTCYVDKTKDRAVSVKFKAANMKTVTIVGREGGEIWLERDGNYGLQAQHCRGKQTCSFKVHYGAPLKFRTEASFGFQFVNWGGDCSGNNYSCKLTADRDVKATATFTKK